jgi:SNF2 family DNA or RNA helicase
MNLFPHQEVAKNFLLQKGRAILADEPRCGKTLPAAFAALEHLPVLVVCPAIVKSVWEQAFRSIDPSIDIRVISGKKDAYSVGGNGVVIINYDLLGSIKMLGKFNTLILDESHRIKSNTAIRTKAALKLMARIPRVYALSGTPIPNRPIELYPLLRGLGIYRGDYYDFAVRYAKMWKAPWGMDVSGASNIPELRSMIAPHTLRRLRSDVFVDYQEPAVSLITFDLPVDKREQEFDADALIDHPNPILAFDGLALIMKEAGNRKVKPASEFIADKALEEKIVVFAHHKDVVYQLAEQLKEFKPAVITGETSHADRINAIKDFQLGDSRVFIGNLQACSEGIDLSVADMVVFVETTWQTSALEQACARIENIQKVGKAPLIYLLTIAQSLDHTILKKILKKQNIINQII